MKIINKAFAILELFIDNGEALSLEQISQLSGINKPTARRIALELIECGYLTQPVRRGRYSLGTKFLDFSGAIKMHNSIVRVSAPELMRLQQQVNESVTMAIWDGSKAALCQSFLADHPLKVVPDEGSRLILHATSVGKALLAELPEEDLPKYLDEPLASYTPNTITDINSLRKHLLICRQEGVTYDDEEYYPGIRGVGAVIRGREGTVVGSLSILGPSVRLTRQRLTEYTPQVKDCARKISRQLGYEPAGSAGEASGRPARPVHQ